MQKCSFLIYLPFFRFLEVLGQIEERDGNTINALCHLQFRQYLENLGLLLFDGLDRMANFKGN